MVVIGLKKRDTFEEVVEYIKHPKDVIKFPDRYAKQIRNSFELSQLDGVGMMEHEEHELQTVKETDKANALRKVARNADDTHHIEFMAHAQQSRPEINTRQTIQQTEPEHHTIHTDTDSGYETAIQGYDKREVVDIRQEAELEHRVLRKASENKITRLTEEHKKEIGDINIYWNDKHHKAQETLQQKLNIQNDSALKMATYHKEIQDERHQADLHQLATKYQGLHQELAHYRDREDQLVIRENDLALGANNHYSDQANKVRVITRSIANEPFNSLSSISNDVPMATPPPAARPLAIEPPPAAARQIGPIATAPAGQAFQAGRSTASRQAETGRRAIATAPLPAAARQGRRPRGEALPRDREGLIQWLETRGVILSEVDKNGGRGKQKTILQLQTMARPY